MTPHPLCRCHRGGLQCPLHEHALATVLRHATSPADARNILEHLGILAPGVRHVLPDPPPSTLHTEASKVPTSPDPWSSPRAQAASGRRPEGCTTPPGLPDLPAVGKAS